MGNSSTPRGESLPAFRNEPYLDFTIEANRTGMHEALARVRREFGREYQLWIGGEGVKAETKLSSLNPSHPDEVVGVHQKATGELAAKAVESAFAFYPEWRRTSAELRAHMLLRVARILRERKLEFDAWLVYEAGKTWPEAEADVSEAIDFCEYYAREMLRYSLPAPVVQLPGERDELRYLPLGVGVIISPWNFPLAIFLGQVTAALMANPLFLSAARPRALTPLILSRYRQGQTYGLRVDDALMGGIRTDLSFTLFLAPPESYDGGALVVQDRIEERAIRLGPGDLVLYPSTTLHRVEPVTAGDVWDWRIRRVRSTGTTATGLRGYY